MKGLKAAARIFIIAWLALAAPGSNARSAVADAGGGPQRVVVMAPAVAEMLEQLGLLDRVVGRGQFGPWPAALAGLPEVGGYDSPSVEHLLALDVNAALTARSEAAARAHQQLEKLGIQVVELDTSTFEGVFDSLETLGRTFNRGAEAAQLAASMRNELREVERRAQGAARRRVLFVIGRDPEYVAGPGSHLDRLIAIAGGVNVAHDLLGPYQQMSKEAILERLPEVIIDSSDNRPEALRGRRAGAWIKWGFLPAVRDNRVYSIDPSQLVIPGIRLPEMARLMGRLIHPEVFGEPRPGDFLLLEYGADAASD